jgi:hypothetical protein
MTSLKMAVMIVWSNQAYLKKYPAYLPYREKFRSPQISPRVGISLRATMSFELCPHVTRSEILEIVILPDNAPPPACAYCQGYPYVK